MEMVAAAKLRRAQQIVEQSKPYSAKLDEMLANLASASTGEISHPYFEEREVVKKTLVLVTADRGLCGSFNANLLRTADAWLREFGREHAELYLLGKKGWDYYRRRDWTVLAHEAEWEGEIDYTRARAVVDAVTGRFVAGETDQVDIVYTRFVSMGRFQVTKERYLPIPRPTIGDESGKTRDYIFEPTPEEIYARLMPYYTTTKLITILRESLASEQASRMLAMNAATKAAGDMIDSLTLDYNKARQAQITKEILEVVSGAEALRG
jgi:F-type H+-transporting ATPase subunit gamma